MARNNLYYLRMTRSVPLLLSDSETPFTLQSMVNIVSLPVGAGTLSLIPTKRFVILTVNEGLAGSLQSSDNVANVEIASWKLAAYTKEIRAQLYLPSAYTQ